MQPVMWDNDGKPHPIAGPDNSSGWATDINDRGQIVGGVVTRASDRLEHAWFWESADYWICLDERVGYERPQQPSTIRPLSEGGSST